MLGPDRLVAVRAATSPWPRGAARVLSHGHCCFQIRLTVLPVELPLIKEELEETDAKLKTAETTLFWSSEGTASCLCPTQHSSLAHPGLARDSPSHISPTAGLGWARASSVWRRGRLLPARLAEAKGSVPSMAGGEGAVGRPGTCPGTPAFSWTCTGEQKCPAGLILRRQPLGQTR